LPNNRRVAVRLSVLTENEQQHRESFYLFLLLRPRELAIPR
jgi:hypothetical protein